VGWHGFSAGSALMANGSAGIGDAVNPSLRFVRIHTWIVMDWLKFGKPSVLAQ